VLSLGAAFDAVVAVMSGLNLSMTPVHVPPGPHVTSQRRQRAHSLVQLATVVLPAASDVLYDGTDPTGQYGSAASASHTSQQHSGLLLLGELASPSSGGAFYMCVPAPVG
jgi:hypothetical protein